MSDPTIFSLSINEAHKLVYAQASYYKNFVRVYIPNEAFKKLHDNVEGGEILEPFYSSDNIYETNKERSLRRTRKSIKDIVFCNDFELFATFTFKDDRQNIDKCKTKITNWLRNEIKRKGKFEYLVVSEFHKDGESIHFHALIKGYTGEVKRSFNNGKPITKKGRDVYEFPSYTSGFTNVQKIDLNLDSQTSLAYYIQKYLTKDNPILFGKNRYRASQGIKKPKIEDNPEPWYKTVKPDRNFKTDHGTFLEFDKGNPLIDIFMEKNKP